MDGLQFNLVVKKREDFPRFIQGNFVTSITLSG